MATPAAVAVLFTATIFMRSSVSAQTVDLTRTPEAKGTTVVDAVVDLIHHSCIFDDDKYFLRRLAFVESQDGTNRNTYRYQYDGGIWQVDKDNFTETKESSYARQSISKLNASSLDIDWHQVTWADLRKPLFSGLAARLFIDVILRGRDLPRDLAGQAEFWHTSYHDSHPPLPTANFTEAANLLKTSCSGDKELDAVFILDSSGSVGRTGFEKAKDFVINWIDAFNIGLESTRVGVISYGNSPTIDFYLTSYTSQTELKENVKKIKYTGGGTNTGDAIDAAVENVFTEAHGARRLVPRAIILVTDGRSNHPSTTRLAADRAKSNKITIFAVGVGSNLGKQELEDVATDPDCTHIFYVDNFAEIDALKQEMHEASCHTVVRLELETTTPQDNSTAGNSTNRQPEEVRCQLNRQCNIVQIDTNFTDSVHENSTNREVVTTVNCSTATVYAAYNSPNPGSAYYELKAVASPSSPAVIYLDKSGKTIYISVEGNPYYVEINKTDVCEAVTTIQEQSQGPRGEVSVICRVGGQEKICTSADLIKAMPDVCKKPDPVFDNPCTRENLLAGLMKFPYPYDLAKFLFCDLAGHAYIVQCPSGHLYNQAEQSCGLAVGHPGNQASGRVPLNPNIANPCTVNAILAGHPQFSYLQDNTRFITWGKAWPIRCSEGFIWDPQVFQCVAKSTQSHVQGPGQLDKDVPNPCTQANIAARRFLFPYPFASDRYIQCDAWGGAYVMLCHLGGHWNDQMLACTPGNKS